MVASNKKIVNIPILNDFIYTLLYEAPYEAKRGLTGKYLKASMNGRAAKAFSVNSTREEKEYILAHFGLEFYYVIHPKKVTIPKLKEILRKYQKDHKIAAMKDIAEEGIYVTGDEQFVHLLRLMAKSIHHPSFFLNLEFNRQGYHIQKWSKRNDNEVDLKDRETYTNDNKIMRLMLNSILEMEFVPGKSGLTIKEMKVLIYLYTYKHLFVPEKDILDFFLGRVSKSDCKSAIMGLLNSQYIQRSALARKEYSITSYGIKQVANYRDTVLTSNNF
jgi:hypothetical protein